VILVPATVRELAGEGYFPKQTFSTGEGPWRFPSVYFTLKKRSEPSVCFTIIIDH